MKSLKEALQKALIRKRPAGPVVSVKNNLLSITHPYLYEYELFAKIGVRYTTYKEYNDEAVEAAYNKMNDLLYGAIIERLKSIGDIVFRGDIPGALQAIKDLIGEIYE